MFKLAFTIVPCPYHKCLLFVCFVFYLFLNNCRFTGDNKTTYREVPCIFNQFSSMVTSSINSKKPRKLTVVQYTKLIQISPVLYSVYLCVCVCVHSFYHVFIHVTIATVNIQNFSTTIKLFHTINL